jgi:transposase-like protein
MQNKYYRRSRISEAKFREVIRLFSLDIEAVKIAQISRLNRNTINRILLGVRERLAEYCEQQSPYSGVVEVDESYFGARRVKGKRGRGAYGKTIVFGIFKRNGHVYTEIVPDCSKATLQAVIRGRVALDTVINSDGWRGYNGLVEVGYEKHLRVDHGRDEFVNGKAHINGIEGFWGLAKVRMTKFRGMNKSTFYLHLKETEFRYNHRQEDISKIILKLCRKNPLN